MEGGSSVESGGPSTLDGGDEVYEALSRDEQTVVKAGDSTVGDSGGNKSMDESALGTSETASAALDKKFRQTLREPLDLNAAMSDSIAIADDFTNDFDESFGEYDNEGFNSDDSAKNSSHSSDALSPNKSDNSPTRTRAGRRRSSTTSKKMDASIDSEKSVASEVNYGSDDFEMMDYEADKPNRKRVRFPASQWSLTPLSPARNMMRNMCKSSFIRKMTPCASALTTPRKP